MWSYLDKPAIEWRFDALCLEVGTRKWHAENICKFLSGNDFSSKRSQTSELFYESCSKILSDRDSERILLYLPLRCLESAPDSFRRAYLGAWHDLLNVMDVRENFHLGDCLELDARPRDGLSRVVKCAHLVPWLLKFGYLEVDELIRILADAKACNDIVLLQSFRDTWGFIQVNHILDAAELYRMIALTKDVPNYALIEPLYVSKKRLAWLDERRTHAELLFPKAKLAGPFSKNVPFLKRQIEEISAQLSPSEIVLVGGSQLKGYATVNSDLDVWDLEELEMSSNLYPGSPDAIHIYFDTIWVGGAETVGKLKSRADAVVNLYSGSALYAHRSDLRRQALERLESDLLQYRLLHKGFARFTGRHEYEIPLEMDGDCPFYDDEYRKIATMLYAKYVWL